jgi:hypothetical protein
MSIRLVTLQSLKDFLEKTDNTQDALLNDIIGWVSKEFETYLNRNLKKEQRTKHFDSGNRIYCLPAYPIDSAATFTMTYSNATQTLNNHYYLYEDEGIVEFFCRTYYTMPKEIAVTWTGGFEEVNNVLNVPDDIKFACVLQSAFVFKRRKDLGLNSINLPDGSVSVLSPTDLLPDVRKILNRYKNKQMGA